MKLIQQLTAQVILPAHISDFERSYLARMNRIGLWFLVLHLPGFLVLATFNHQDPIQALWLTGLLLAGPVLAYNTLSNPRSISLIYGFTAMLMGGLLVHLGQGTVQIEMHFYFFAMLAMLAVYANPLVIVVAAVTVAVHHLTLWAYLPHSIFNYAAPLWVVLVHASFVVVESIATAFIARSFFDNVIGLEKLIMARTEELDARNRDMRLVLDNVHEGLFTIDRDAVISGEQSHATFQWLGPAAKGMDMATYMTAPAPEFASDFQDAWAQVVDGYLPMAMALGQLPARFDLGLKHFQVEYKPILQGEALEKVLVMISDISADVERERLERRQRDVLAILQRIGDDKSAVLEFFSEARELVHSISDVSQLDLTLLRRQIHTLKGNAMVFGVLTIAELCHRLESQIDELNVPPHAVDRTELHTCWDELCSSVSSLLGDAAHPKLELDDREYEAILKAVLRSEKHVVLAKMVSDWKLEPTRRRLHRFAEQARGIARKLDKGALRIEIQDHGLRTDPHAWAPFWSAFVHVVRNAVDHGIESPDERRSAGKQAQGSLELGTRLVDGEFVVEIKDDGRGIDWARVAARAGDNGLPHQSRADLVRALFSDGMTTKDEVGDYSGRGIGMGAIQAACQQLGGRMDVQSEKNTGTFVAFSFPQSAMYVTEPLRIAN